jgi:hypothetical protein
MVYVANKLLQKRSNDVVNLKLTSQELESQETAYLAAKKDIEKYSDLNAIVKSVIPQDKDQARTVRELFQLAQDSGIALKSVQFPSSSLGTAAAASTTTPAAGATAPAAGAAPTPAPPTITQAKPVKGLNGVYAIQTDITPFADSKTARISYDQLIDFLRRIESNRRTMQVTTVHIQPLGQKASSGITFTLTLNIFVKP